MIVIRMKPNHKIPTDNTLAASNTTRCKVVAIASINTKVEF
jgi:hypothetical protein